MDVHQGIGVLGDLPSVTFSIDFSSTVSLNTAAATSVPDPWPTEPPMSYIPQEPCPRPANDTGAGNFPGAPLLSSLDQCYFATVCPNTTLWDPEFSAQYRWFASGASLVMQVIEEAFNNDTKLIKYANSGLKTASNGQFNWAVAQFFSDAYMTCTIGGTECTPPTNQYDCDAYGAAGYNILASYANLFDTVSIIHTALTDAIGTIDLGSVNSTFWAPSQTPAPLSGEDFLNIMLAFLGGFGGVVGDLANGASAAESLIGRNYNPEIPKLSPSSGNATSNKIKSVIGTTNSIISGVIGALPSAPGSGLDVQSALAAIENTTLTALEDWVYAIFQVGQFHMPPGQVWETTFENYTRVESDVMRIDDLMANGALLTRPVNDTSDVVRGNVTRILYMQLAEFSWKNDGGIVPFITWDDAPCGQVAAVYLDTAIDQNRMLANVTEAQVTVDGKCYYLLGATPSECKVGAASSRIKRGDPPPGWGVQTLPCCSVQLLPGGNHDVLNGSTFAGLQVSDFVASSVATWMANDQKNGGNASAINSQPSTFPQSLISAGMSNIPVCDYRNLNDPGVDCPDLTQADSCPLLNPSTVGSTIQQAVGEVLG